MFPASQASTGSTQRAWAPRAHPGTSSDIPVRNPKLLSQPPSRNVLSRSCFFRMLAKTMHGRSEGLCSPCQGGNSSLRKGRNIFPEHRASPNSVVCPIFTASSLLIFLCSPKGLNNGFSQSTSPTVSPRKPLSSVTITQWRKIIPVPRYPVHHPRPSWSYRAGSGR